MDSPPAEEAGVKIVRIVHLQFANAEDIARLVKSVYERQLQIGGIDDEYRVVPDKRTNSIIIHAENKKFDEIMELIRQLDVDKK